MACPGSDKPLRQTQQAEAAGIDHYADTCLACHGAPGVPPKEFAKGLNPPAPNLIKSLNNRSDAELFWIVKNGLRMTGMPALGPTHTDDDIWKVVSFVRTLPTLSEEQTTQLIEALGSGHEHGQSDHDSDSPADHGHSDGHAHRH
ncbi:c-type cytochrome [Aeoliella sp.]|uniref:c-type cytochrome n=1 Tax=Aeoliella sp. TaxID=2795800 RepID=UPI003CCBB289